MELAHGGTVMDWPEFKALMARLGKEIHPEAVCVTIRLAVDEVISVTEECELLPPVTPPPDLDAAPPKCIIDGITNATITPVATFVPGK